MFVCHQNGKPRAVLLLFCGRFSFTVDIVKRQRRRGGEKHTERNSAENFPAPGWRRPSLDRGAIDRLERDSKDPVPRQTGPAPMSARLSLIHTHTFPYSLCQLIFFFHLFLPLTSSYRFCVPPTQTSLSQHDWLRYVNWGI